MIKEYIAIKSIAPAVKISFNSSELTCFDYITNTLNIGSDFDNSDNGFFRHVAQKHHFTQPRKYSLALWTILHELGHYANFDNPLEDKSHYETRILCGMVDPEIAASSPKLQDLYFDLPDEWVATEWAINYIESHPIKVKILNFLLSRVS